MCDLRILSFKEHGESGSCVCATVICLKGKFAYIQCKLLNRTIAEGSHLFPIICSLFCVQDSEVCTSSIFNLLLNTHIVIDAC